MRLPPPPPPGALLTCDNITQPQQVPHRPSFHFSPSFIFPLRAGSITDATVRLPPLPPGACFADIYDIVLLVDNREQVRALPLHIGRLNCWDFVRWP